MSKAALEVKLEREKNKLMAQKKKAAALGGEIASLMDEVDETMDVKHQKDVKEWLDSDNEPKANVPTGLFRICGRKGEPFSLDMAELGMELMSRGMTAPSARGVFIVFMKKAHPGLALGKDYRVPDAKQFKVTITFYSVVVFVN